MTIGGWVSMTITLGFVLGLFGWCCYKMTTAPENVDVDVEQDMQKDNQ